MPVGRSEDGRVRLYEAIGRTQKTSGGRATALYRTVLEDPHRSAGDQVYYRARLAGALLNDGDVKPAITEGSAILSSMTGGRMTSVRSLAEMRPLRVAAEQAAAEEFCARFDAALHAVAV